MIICFTFLIHKEGLLNKEKLCAITFFFALDKETPTNIPYFGDEVIEKDTHFIESMVEEVYLVNHEEEKFNLTDDVFMKLIAAVNSYREEGLFSSTNTYIYIYILLYGDFLFFPPSSSFLLKPFLSLDPRPGLVLHHPGSDAEMDYYSESQKNIKLPGLIVFQVISVLH